MHHNNRVSAYRKDSRTDKSRHEARYLQSFGLDYSNQGLEGKRSRCAIGGHILDLAKVPLYDPIQL